MYGSSDQTINQKSEPWGPAQGPAQQAIGIGQELMNYWYDRIKSGDPMVYSGPRVASLQPAQTETYNKIAQMFGQGFGPYTTQAAAYTPLTNYSSGAYNESQNAAVQDAYNNLVQPTLKGTKSGELATLYKEGAAAPSGLSDTVTGKMLDPSTNPWLTKYQEQGARQLADSFNTTAGQINSKPSGYGGSANALLNAENSKNLGNSLQDLSTNIYGGAYNQERANQLQGMRDINSAYSTESQKELGLANMLNQSWMQGQQNQINALGMLPQFDTQAAKNLGNVVAVGDALQQYDQNKINAGMQQYNEQLWQPYNLLSSLSNLFFTGGQAGGVKQQSGAYQTPSLASQLLGTGTGVANLYGQLQQLGLFG